MRGTTTTTTMESRIRVNIGNSIKRAKPTIQAGIVLVLVLGARATTFTIGATTTVLTPTQRNNVASTNVWPDGTMAGLLNGSTSWLCNPNGTNNNVQSPLCVTTDFSSFTLIRNDGPIQRGGGGAFDQNYASGSAVYWDAADGILFHMYHGEYWYNFCVGGSNPGTACYSNAQCTGGGSCTGGATGSPFYAALGMAYSTDCHQTPTTSCHWTKMGEVITPQALRSGVCQVDTGVGSLLDKGDGFLYAYYVDMTTACGDFEIAVARAAISDLVGIVHGTQSITGSTFQKYAGGAFSAANPGMNNPADPAAGGGAFTPIFPCNGGCWIPNIRFDSAISRYIMAYANSWNGLNITASNDGLTGWDSTTAVVTQDLTPHACTDPNGGFACFYPSLINATASADPQNLGGSFYMYWVDHFANPSNSWGSSNLNRTLITISGGSPPTITTCGASSSCSLPDATVGVAYSQTLTTTGGTGSISCSITSGTPPPGLSFTSGTCTIAGIPTSGGGGGGGGITFKGGASVSNNGTDAGTSPTLNVASGDFLIVGCLAQDGGGTTSFANIGDTAGNFFHSVKRIGGIKFGDDSIEFFEVFNAIANAADVIKCNANVGANYADVVLQFSGLPTTDPSDVSTTGTVAQGATVTSNTFTPTLANEVSIACAGGRYTSGNPSPFVAGTGYTIPANADVNFDDGTGHGVHEACEYKLNPMQASQTAAMSTTTNPMFTFGITVGTFK